VRLARYHTGRSHLVRFCGAYHGWWGTCKPGVGNPIAARETYTLKDVDRAALKVLRTRRDIACVLVNPLQALHPNSGAPGDSTLVDSGRKRSFRPCGLLGLAQRTACRVQRAKHRADFRRGVRWVSGLGLGARRNTSAVQADMVTYGKTVAGGLPIGVLWRTAAIHAPLSR